MAEFSQLLKTVKGKALDAKILAGKEKLTFNFVKTSSHTYEESELETLEILEGVKQSVERTGIQIRDNHVVTIKAAFRNDELTEGYYIRAIGLYAIDPDEGTILYAVTVEKTGNCYISAYNQKAVNGISVKLNLKIDDADKVDLTIDPAAVATMQDILDLDSQKIPIQGGDISDTVINIENPPDEDKNPVKYPEIGDSGTTKSIMGQIRRWLKSLKDDKVDKKGGDTADTVVSGLTDSTASFPQPTAGDSQKTLWGKVKKWQQDCITKFGNYVLTSMITNQHLNSASNIPTSALVYLMQQAIQQNQQAINVLNTKHKVLIKKYTKVIKIPANSFTGSIMLDIQPPSGLKAVGILGIQTDYPATITPTLWYLNKGNQIAFCLYSTYGSELTCTVFFHVLLLPESWDITVNN